MNRKELLEGSSRKEVLLERVIEDPKDRKTIYENTEKGRIPDPKCSIVTDRDRTRVEAQLMLSRLDQMLERT